MRPFQGITVAAAFTKGTVGPAQLPTKRCSRVTYTDGNGNFGNSTGIAINVCINCAKEAARGAATRHDKSCESLSRRRKVFGLVRMLLG